MLDGDRGNAGLEHYSQTQVRTSTTADIKDDLILEESLVVVHKVAVRIRSDFVLKHSLVDVLVALLAAKLVKV